MKKTTMAERLKYIMRVKNLKQADILWMVEPFCTDQNVRIGKSILSQYLAGRVEPGPDRLSILSKALGVSEVWLMGYDVPMTSTVSGRTDVTPKELRLIHAYRMHPEFQGAIDKLLSMEEQEELEENTPDKYLAARAERKAALAEARLAAKLAQANARDAEAESEEG